MVKYIKNSIICNFSIKKLLIIFIVLSLLTLNSLLITDCVGGYFTYFFNYPTIIFIVHGILFILFISNYVLNNSKLSVFEFTRIKSKYKTVLYKILIFNVLILIYISILHIFSITGVILSNKYTNIFYVSYFINRFSLSVEFYDFSTILLIALLSLILFFYFNFLSVFILIVYKFNLKDILLLVPPITVNLFLMGISSLPESLIQILYKMFFLRLFDISIGITPTKNSIVTMIFIWLSVLIILYTIVFINKSFFNFSKRYLFLIHKQVYSFLIINMIIDIGNIFLKIMWNDIYFLNNKFYIVDTFNLISTFQFFFLYIVFFYHFTNVINIIKNKYGIFILTRTKNFALIYSSFYLIIFSIIFCLISYATSILIQLIILNKIIFNSFHITYVLSYLSLVFIWILIYELNVSSVNKSIICLISIFITNLIFLKLNSIFYSLCITILLFTALLYLINAIKRRRENIYAV